MAGHSESRSEPSFNPLDSLSYWAAGVETAGREPSVRWTLVGVAGAAGRVVGLWIQTDPEGYHFVAVRVCHERVKRLVIWKDSL
jgi:hypothetical protein